MRVDSFAGLALVAAALLPVPAGADEVSVHVAAPRDGLVLPGPVPYVDVRGRAGVRGDGGHDVVIVLDLSGSTLIASGADVDGDGVLGWTNPVVERALFGGVWLGGFSESDLCSDFGDSVRAAEVAAARRLVSLLDAERTRVAIVTFHARAYLEAPLGASREELTAALDRIELAPRGGHLGYGTNFRHALEQAADAFPGEWSPGDPQRSILFLSDGQPTLPGRGERPKRKALEMAERAARRQVRIHSFALGPAVIEHLGIYHDIAEVSGGRLTRVEDPAAIMTLLPRVQLADVADVTIENRTHGERARAPRLFPDGSFDGVVPLRPGPNRLRVTARAESGAEVHVERTVRYAPRPPRSDEEAEAQRRTVELFVEELRLRTAETAELQEIERARQRREVDVRVEP